MKKQELKTAFDEHKEPQIDTPNVENIYTEEERKYRQFLIDRLIDARDQRDQHHDELDGMTYPEYYESNLKGAISYIPPRENKDEVQVVTGTTREKKLAIMAAVNNLNLETEIQAYDKENFQDIQVGSMMTDAINKSEELENWNDEAKMLAYDELTTQGNVFIEELWWVETKWDKKKIKLDKIDDSTFKNFKPENKIKEIFKGCKRNVVPGLFVYLGNIKEFDEQQQPYIYTREAMTLEQAKALYGTWNRWKYVAHTFTTAAGEDSQDDVYAMNFRVENNTPENWVEVIKYQDRWNDEFMIMINGVMMLPAEFPMPWESGCYNITKGNLEPISPNFAYCKSVVAKTKTDQQVFDEMYRLAILKTKKSFLPPIANYSQQILTQSAFLPGKVHNDLMKGELEVLGGNPSLYALNQSEMAMMEMVKRFIDEKSINPVAAGEQPQGDPTATQTLLVSQQAKVRLGLMVFGFMALHKKLAYQRIYNILENWTKPIGTKVDEIKGAVVSKYMSFTVPAEFSEGAGERLIEFTEEKTPVMELIDREEGITRNEETRQVIDKKKRAKPRRIVQVNPKELRAFKYNWKAVVTVSERETSLVNRLVFNENLTQAYQLFGLESVNRDYAQQKWASINKVPANKFFNQGNASRVPAELQEALQNGGKPQERVSSQLRPKAKQAGAKELMREGA